MTLSLMYSPSFLSPKSSAEGFASCKKNIKKPHQFNTSLFSLDRMAAVILFTALNQTTQGVFFLFVCVCTKITAT